MINKMNDYLNVLKKGLSNIPNITQGWINSVKDKFDILSPELKEVANKRIGICNGCPFNSEAAKANLGYDTSLDYYHCSSCKCPIDKKVFSFAENCGLEWFMLHPSEEDQKHIIKHYSEHPEESIELKWTKHEK